MTEAEKKNMSEINYEEVHSRIAEARKEYANGEISSNEEVNKEIEQWLNEK